MNVLSLFDGISCGQIALNRANIPYDNYYASEIKPHAIKCTLDNYPNTIQLGNILNLKASDLPKIDLFIGGSPCKGISRLNKNQEGLEHSVPMIDCIEPGIGITRFLENLSSYLQRGLMNDIPYIGLTVGGDAIPSNKCSFYCDMARIRNGTHERRPRTVRENMAKATARSLFPICASN